jgi:hypothetical protein
LADLGNYAEIGEGLLGFSRGRGLKSIFSQRLA